MVSSKAEEWELIKVVHQAYKVGETGTTTLAKVLAYQLEALKTHLMLAGAQEFPRLQGECNAIREILRMITTEKVPIPGQVKEMSK